MGTPDGSLDIVVLQNADFVTLGEDRADHASRADVANAARGVAAALVSRGHRARVREIDGATVPAVLAALSAEPPDLVFNLCESLCGDARHEVVVPALLDLAGIPYTGSGPLAVSLAVRKDRAKELLRARGVPTPEAAVATDAASARAIDIPFPLIVKPVHEDASVGITMSSVVRDRAALGRAVARVVEGLAQPALVERFIEGREIYVSLLGNAPPRALPFHEIDFTDLPAGLPRIVSYAGKWDTGSPECIGTRPTRCLVDEPTRARLERTAQAAFAALELADYGRVDVRLSADGTPYVIDVNANCDVSDGAGFARAASSGGLDYPAFIERVCRLALERHATAR